MVITTRQRPVVSSCFSMKSSLFRFFSTITERNLQNLKGGRHSFPKATLRVFAWFVSVIGKSDVVHLKFLFFNFHREVYSILKESQKVFRDIPREVL